MQTHKYWGDKVRQVLVGAALLMILGSPVYSDALAQQFPFEIAGAMLAAMCGLLTGPYRRWVEFLNICVSGLLVAVYESWALAEYGQISDFAFIFRQAIAILFLIAFYYSLQTLRSTLMHSRSSPEDELTDEAQQMEREHKNPLAVEEAVEEDDMGGD